MPPKHHHRKPGKLPWFGRSKARHRRVAAVRLDMGGESTGTAFGRGSNRVALALLALLLLGAGFFGVRETDWRSWFTRNPLTETEKGGTEPAPRVEAEPAGPAEEIPAFEPEGLPEDIARLALAMEAVKIGRGVEARQLLDDAITHDPSLVGWFYIKGLVEWGLGANGAAKSAFRESIRRGQAVGPSTVRLGDIALMESDTSEAVQRYRQVAELHPRDPWLRLKWGIALRRAGDAYGGLERIRQGARLRPDDDDFRAWIFLAEAEVNPPKKGVVKGKGTSALWHVVAAVEAHRLGDFDGTVRALQTFRAESNEIQRELAAVDLSLVRLGENERLRAIIPKAKIGPDDPSGLASQTGTTGTAVADP
jgi:tetratricopeptide (TPR) repeat protein